MFIQGWVHEDLDQHTQDNFGEDWMTRFLRFAAEEGFPQYKLQNALLIQFEIIPFAKQIQRVLMMLVFLDGNVDPRIRSKVRSFLGNLNVKIMGQPFIFPT